MAANTVRTVQVKDLMMGILLALTASAASAAAPNTPKWVFSTGDHVHSSPAIGSDGTVYVGSFDDNVYALDGQSGRWKWTFTTGDQVKSSPALGQDGTVYVGSEDGSVYALNGQTGKQAWVFQAQDSVQSSPTIGSDGTVYVGSDDDNVYALNGQTGKQKWVFTTNDQVRSSPAIGPDGTVYVGSEDGNIYALNGQTGKQVWVFTTGLFVDASPAIGSDGTVYVGSNDNNVYALNGQTGKPKWIFTTGNSVESSPAIGSDGTVYVGSLDRNVYALNGQTGSPKWVSPTADLVISSPAIGSDGTIYVGCLDSNLYALDGQTGSQKWTFPTGFLVTSSPAIGSDGTIYVGSWDDNVYAVNGATSAGLQAGSSWPMFHLNGFHTGRVPSSTTTAVTLTPAAVIAGQGSTGTVSITPQVPPGGALLTLFSSAGSAVVPAQVAVPAGATTAQFPISTNPVAVQTAVIITATIRGSTATAALNVVPIAPISFTLNPTSALEGSSSTATVTLNAPAPSGGQLLTLSSTGPAASVHSTVTAPAGATSVSFPIQANAVTVQTTATLQAECNGVSVQGTLVVRPLSIASVVLTPASVLGGQGSSGTVTLSGPAPTGGILVSLSSNATTARLGTAAATVPAGTKSTTFSITTLAVVQSIPVTITAGIPGSMATAVLNVLPVAPISFTLNPTSTSGGSSATATVTLNAPAPAGGQPLTLSSSSLAAPVPPSVTVPPGALTVSFSIQVNAVTVQTTAILQAKCNGVTAQGTLVVIPLALISATSNPTGVTGAASATGTVTLSGPAPAGGTLISLKSGNVSVAAVKTTVTIPAGASSTTFTVTTTAVSAATPVTITASCGGISKVINLTVNPPALQSLAISPATVTGGSVVQGTIKLSGPAPVGGVQVLVKSSLNASITLTVLAGASSVQFNYASPIVSATSKVSLTASYGGVTQSAVLTVNPAVLLNITLALTSITAGQTTTGAVNLTGPAPTGGLVVTLSSSSPSVVAFQPIPIPPSNPSGVSPLTVIIPAGATSGKFGITSKPNVPITAVITASAPGSPPVMISIKCNSVLSN